jgi:hypothetical protein
MPDDDRSRIPHAVDTPSSRQEVKSVRDQLYEMEMMAFSQPELGVRYQMLKQIVLLAYGLTGNLRARTGQLTADFKKDLDELDSIYKAVSTDKVPVPSTPRLEPLAYRDRGIQYDVLGPQGQSLSQAFGPDLKVIVKDIHMANEAIGHYAEGCNRMYAHWARVHFILARYGLWHFETRIYLVETGYDSGRRREGLARLQTTTGEPRAGGGTMVETGGE